MARVRQAQASAVIAGAPLLPELNATLGASRQKTLRDSGYSGTDATSDNDAVDSFSAGLSASYEVDFWGGRRAAYRSALESLKASEYDRATVELTLLSGVANSYLQVLALREQQRIARLNLDNAEHVLRLVETRHAAGSATALEVAQQSSLVASQRKQLPLLEQQAHEALITLATLIGEPVQALQVAERPSTACAGRRPERACRANCSAAVPISPTPKRNWPRPRPTCRWRARRCSPS